MRNSDVRPQFVFDFLCYKHKDSMCLAFYPSSTCSCLYYVIFYILYRTVVSIHTHNTIQYKKKGNKMHFSTCALLPKASEWHGTSLEIKFLCIFCLLQSVQIRRRDCSRGCRDTVKITVLQLVTAGRSSSQLQLPSTLLRLSMVVRWSKPCLCSWF